MDIRHVGLGWLGSLCTLILIPLSGCQHRDFIKAYEQGSSARQPLTVGDRTYAIDPDGWCSEVRVDDSTGTRSWRTGLRSGKIVYPSCRQARFSHDGRYLLVPYESQFSRRKGGGNDPPSLPILLIVIDLVDEREIKRVDIADPEAFHDAFFR